MELQKPSDSATSTIPRTDDTDDTDELDQQSRPVRLIQLDLSAAQVAGGSLAAATAAALSSQLGVAGTIAGAAVISVVTAVAGALYTQSLRRTRAHARAVAALIALRRNRTDEPPAAIGPPARLVLRPRRLIAGILVVFALAVAGITGFELLTGHPLSGGAAGTTLGELTGTGSDADSGGRRPAPADQQPSLVPEHTSSSATPTPQRSEPSTSAPSTEPSSPTPTAPTDPSPPTGSARPADTASAGGHDLRSVS